MPSYFWTSVDTWLLVSLRTSGSLLNCWSLHKASLLYALDDLSPINLNSLSVLRYYDGRRIYPDTMWLDENEHIFNFNRKSELILETERRKDVKRPKIVILTFYYARKRCWEHLKSFPNQQQPRECKVVDMRIARPTAIFSCKKPITKKIICT